ncbi:DNA replication regulator Sld3 [Metarhizium rileyi]|uniref:DNA replication regulator Sld3 n=1 Tax=Metarhizium rileyi (strain RCEF 4871) TaxID=1649241 RepID=A0A166YT15_METRR|nr:DNA replication regulator Sld3 [Metarhizium rileyi RCEF 4871]
MDPLLKPSITVKPHPPNLHTQPRVLLPLMLLPREHLPLSSLDFSAPDNELPQTRFVESHIKILDLESRLGASPSVVIARNESKRTIYALERQKSGLYVMCKLGSWIDLGELVSRATALCPERLAPARRDGQSRDSSVSLGALLTTPNLHKEQKKKRAAIEAIQSLVRKKSKPQAVLQGGGSNRSDDDVDVQTHMSRLPSPEIKTDQHDGFKNLTNVQNVPVTYPSVEDALPASSQHTADIIFDNIRTQYFEALYRSMGSLAYFAKGPLSRARSAFHLDLESNLDMADLIDFLKSLILTTVQIDKKYRETIPGVISRMKTFIETSDEGGKKKRKPRKIRLGKDSLYPLEDESIRTWWNANKPETTEEATPVSTTHIKSHISMLRTRETQLQMILILEILALEPLKAAEEAADSNLPTLPTLPGAESQQDQVMAPPCKKRNKHNLPVLLDVHADRLTIWQSTAFDEHLLLADSQSTQNAEGQIQQKASSEPLKDFCVDVIVPFFSARLPEPCDAISRKLGGPVIVSPIKSNAPRRSSSKKEQRPGAATKRPAPLNSRRTLQRALSTEQLHRRSVSRGPSNAIALLRSATSTSVPGIKREGSEPLSLKEPPRGDSLMGRSRQSSLSRGNRTSNHEDAKASKKALVEAELKDAISALRKPNREVVGKAMEEADERRAMTSLSAKKVNKMPRSAQASSIQIKATPANNRFRNVLAADTASFADISLEGTEDFIPPSSSVGHLIPSTGHRHSHRNALADSASPDTNLVGGTSARASPQASFIKRMAHGGPAIPLSSPLMSRTTRTKVVEAMESQYTAGNSMPFGTLTKQQPEDIMATPVKKHVSKLDFFQSPVLMKGINSQKTVSIYEKLGWDYDFDDDV